MGRLYTLFFVCLLLILFNAPQLKICASFYQIISQFTITLSVPFPAIFTDLMRSIGSLLNVEVFSLLKVGCVMGNSYHRTLAFTIIMPLVISVFIGIATLIKAEYSKRIALKSQPRYREKDELVRKFKLDNQTNLEEAKKLKVIASDQSLFDLKSSKVKPNEIARQRRASLQRPGENDELAKKKGRQLLKLEEELEKLEILATDNSSDIKASGVTAFLVFTYLGFA